jgi:membrane fusion protein (multidrug efflux system)
MNLDELFANVNIPGQHMLSIEQGLPAVIDSDLIEGVRYDAFVKLVSPIVDPESGTFKAKVAVSKLNGMPIYPGMFVNVRIIVDTSDDAVLVPKEAIVHEGDLKYIFKVQNGKAKKTLLQEGYSNVGFVQATSDIVKGDLVIVMGHSALKDGANVKIVKEAVAAEQGTTNSSDAGQG